ncbi:hypothetical protein P175DRAFT_0504674 [Aspergillus ochraceoroseus IBT 24754]|uniref:SnoaL-like domain-containing protein n=2 Tax=Aspergillus ochraceoroseus TaxID=138278 RepID=A0A2T5LNR8_9EURO|nr:uncharacterized protein P175DRAFT_0504674 [Aspergillus ochraceoroseus IBT 24754]KKK20863.1 hypothetical protein AOCH_003971 [Aspergillus ochraceoroseus]PTU17931.1 hypothetical protein P175DRAFT_0504674 [Aspergillus ochraceoroseus IBT 24754]
MASKRLETAKVFVNHFATLDREALESVLAENSLYQFAPAALNLFGPLDRQGMLDHNTTLRNIFNGFAVIPKEYIDSEIDNKVVVWATSRTDFRDDAKDDGLRAEDWVYEGEYVFILSMDEAGERITRVIEFLDSKKTAEKLVGLMARAKQNRAKRLG